MNPDCSFEIYGSRNDFVAFINSWWGELSWRVTITITLLFYSSRILLGKLFKNWCNNDKASDGWQFFTTGYVKRYLCSKFVSLFSVTSSIPLAFASTLNFFQNSNNLQSIKIRKNVWFFFYGHTILKALAGD